MKRTIFAAAATVVLLSGSGAKAQEALPQASDSRGIRLAPAQAQPAPVHVHPTAPAQAEAQPLNRQPMPEEARAYILWPPDGAVIRGGFWLRMGLSGAGVAPAGVRRSGTGHHHLLINVDLPPLDEPIPNDRNHLHFGLGQTEARIDLPPGRHTLQLLLGDEDHVPHDPPLYSRRITVTVTP